MTNAKLKATLRRASGTHVVTCFRIIKTVSAFIVWY